MRDQQGAHLAQGPLHRPGGYRDSAKPPGGGKPVPASHRTHRGNADDGDDAGCRAGIHGADLALPAEAVAGGGPVCAGSVGGRWSRRPTPSGVPICGPRHWPSGEESLFGLVGALYRRQHSVCSKRPRLCVRPPHAFADESQLQRQLWSLAGQALDAAPVASAPRLYVDSLQRCDRHRRRRGRRLSATACRRRC